MRGLSKLLEGGKGGGLTGSLGVSTHDFVITVLSLCVAVLLGNNKSQKKLIGNIAPTNKLLGSFNPVCPQPSYMPVYAARQDSHTVSDGFDWSALLVNLSCILTKLNPLHPH